MREFLSRLAPLDRVLLIGDTRQHQGVEAGRPFEQLQEAGMRTAKLDQIVSQKNPELKSVVEMIATGQVSAALDALQKQGRVREIPDQLKTKMKGLISESPIRAHIGKVEKAPPWIPRKDAEYIVVTCPECLRSSSIEDQVGQGIGRKRVHRLWSDGQLSGGFERSQSPRRQERERSRP